MVELDCMLEAIVLTTTILIYVECYYFFLFTWKEKEKS